MNPAGQGRRTRRGTASTSGEGEQALSKAVQRGDGWPSVTRSGEAPTGGLRGRRLTSGLPRSDSGRVRAAGDPRGLDRTMFSAGGGLDSPRSWRRGRGRQWEAPKRWTRPDPSPSPGRSCRAGGRGRSSAASPWPGLGPLLLGLRSPPAPPSASEALRA